MELAQELRTRGHANRLLAVGLGHEGGREPGLPPLTESVRQGPKEVLRAAWGLHRVLRRTPVDVILVHGAAAALVAVLASPLRGPALVWQRILALTAGSFVGFRGVCWRIAVRRIDGVVALTAELGAEVGRLGYRGPVWRMPNARRTERFEGLDHAVESARLRAELGLGPDAGLVGLVGYLVHQKRPLRAVKVLDRLRRDGHDVHLVVAGSGPLTGAMEREAGACGVAGHLSLLGHRDDVERILAGVDLLILTSEDEGVPGVVVEAAMAGCPVVTYPVGGVAEVVEDGVTGVVLAETSPKAMAVAVEALLRDPAQRQRMRVAAVGRSGAFSLETMARQYEEHLEAAITERGR